MSKDGGTGPVTETPSKRESENGSLGTPEQVDEWLACDERDFQRGNKAAWHSALGLAKLAGHPPPEWSWHFVVNAVNDWSSGRAPDLQKALGLTLKGKRTSRELATYEGTFYFVTNELLKQNPSRPRDEQFWLEVAEAASKLGSPPVGWEKARKMYATAKKSRDKIA
jgi:hypothetical protein